MREVENNVHLRVYAEDVRRIDREVEREECGYRKLSKRKQNLIALNDVTRAGNYERTDEIQPRMDHDTERNREKTTATCSEQAAFLCG